MSIDHFILVLPVAVCAVLVLYGRPRLRWFVAIALAAFCYWAFVIYVEVIVDGAITYVEGL